MKRIYQAAKELGISSKAMLKLLKRLEYDVSSPMAPITQEMIDACIEHFEKNKERAKIREVEKRKIRTKVRKSTHEKIKERQAREKERAEKKIRETMTKIEMGERTKKYKKETKPIEEPEGVKKIRLNEMTSVRELASFLRIDPLDLIAKCLHLGLSVTINRRLDYETAATIAGEYGYEAELSNVYEEKEEVQPQEEVIEQKEPRHPVVTVMGHVDHGKTTLLDYIRHTNVTETEVGKITQHIGAYKVKVRDGVYITFIDTPGHEAFTAMRTRGAKVTDIVILVISADEGVKPQTIEAINHAKEAGVPIIVAINKIDLPNAAPEKVEKQLLDYKLVTEKYGGDVLCTKISAKTGEGVQELLETVLMQAELLELQANTKVEAKATIIESKLDKGKGPIATAIIHQGVLKIGDPILVGNVSGRVRALYNEWGKNKSKAFPADPIQIVGLDDVPNVGDTLRVIRDERIGREVSRLRKDSMREEIAKWRKPTVEDIQEIRTVKAQELKIIIKGDVAGSAEALSDTLHHLSTDEIKVNVIHQAPGEINESDVLLAVAAGAIILGFNTKANAGATQLAKEKGVMIRTYNIIYEAIEDVQLAIKGLLPTKFEEYLLGKAQVKQMFKISGTGFIAGCQVLEGKIVRGQRVRVKRDASVVCEGKVESLKRFKESVKEVNEGLECGVGLDKPTKLEPGDIIEVYEIREVQPG